MSRLERRRAHHLLLLLREEPMMHRLRRNLLKPHQREKMKPRMRGVRMLKLQLKKEKEKNMTTRRKLLAPPPNPKEERSMSMKIVKTMSQNPRPFSRMILMSFT